VTADNPRPYTEIGHRIADLRRETGRREGGKFTQPMLAHDVGVSAATVAAWETGRQQPAGPNLLALATRLGTTPEYLLTGEEPPAAEHRAGEANGALLFTEDGALGLIGGIAPPGEESDLKADQLQLIRQVALRRGIPLPPWWYDLLRQVDAGQV
jgi:transcriptional regulator with XRE-family HTH domain